MHCNKTRLAALAGGAILCGQASAFVWSFGDPLDGLQETPPNASPATGIASGTYDDVTNSLSLDLFFTGLVAAQTAAHIHTAPPGVAGPVTIPLPLGTFTGFGAVLTAAQEVDFLAGNMYVNVHTTAFPGGEIRGQLHPVPEPASFLVLAAGIGILAARRRK